MSEFRRGDHAGRVWGVQFQCVQNSMLTPHHDGNLVHRTAAPSQGHDRQPQGQRQDEKCSHICYHGCTVGGVLQSTNQHCRGTVSQVYSLCRCSELHLKSVLFHAASHGFRNEAVFYWVQNFKKRKENNSEINTES